MLKMGPMKVKNRKNLLQNLQTRQLYGRLAVKEHEKPPRLIHTIPNRLVYRLKDIIPRHEIAKGHIFLGFLRGGYFLVSYTRKQTGVNFLMPHYKFRLQFWLFYPGQPLKLVRETSLFDDGTTFDSMLITVSQWPQDNSKVLVVGYSLDLFNGECHQSVAQVTVAAVPPLGACFDCSKRSSTCLQHGFLLHAVYSLGASAATDPRITGFVKDHILLNTSSNLICYHYSHVVREKSKDTSSEPVISPPMSPLNEEGPLPEEHQQMLQWHLSRLREAAPQTETSTRQTPEVKDDEELSDGWRTPTSDEDESSENNRLFCVPKPLHEAVHWKLPVEASKQTMFFFSEIQPSSEKGNIFLYNEKLENELHYHSQPPTDSDEYIQMRESNLDLDLCAHIIAENFCKASNKKLIQTSNYDGRIVDFCPYSKLVTVSLCIQLQATTPQNFHNYRDRLTHVYELFVILRWSVVSTDLRVIHLQQSLTTLDSLKKATQEQPESFKDFQRCMRNLREEKTPIRADLNIMSNVPYIKAKSISRLTDPDGIFCIAL